MLNFLSTSALPVTGRAEEKKSSPDPGIDLTANLRGQCTTQNPVPRFTLCLLMCLMVFTTFCVPMLQVRTESKYSRHKDQSEPERPTETWDQVKLGQKELTFLTQNIYTNSIGLHMQSNGAERAGRRGRKFRPNFGKVGRRPRDIRWDVL